MARSKKKPASKVAVPAPASSPVKPLKNRKREAENELVRAKKRKGPKNGKPASESHSERSGVEEVAVAAPPPPSNGRSEEEQSTGLCGSKTLVFKNIPCHAQQADILEFFKSAGEVVDVRLAMREGGSFKGSGYVVFATAEEAQKALDLNNKKFLKRSVKLFLEKRTNFDCSKTLIFKNISCEAQKADVLGFFKSAGEVVDVRLGIKGRGLVVFATAEEAQRALLELNGEKLLERSVLLFPGRKEKKEECGKSSDGFKTLVFKNISYEAQKAEVLEFFKSAGDVVDVRLAMNEDDSFKGRGHVVFATSEETQRALLGLNGKKLLGRSVLLFPGKEEKKVECGKSFDGSKILVFKNIPYHAQKADILEFFQSAGEVVDVRLAMREGDLFNGSGYVVFATTEEAQKALLELNNKKFLERSVDLFLEKRDFIDGSKILVFENIPYHAQKADILEFFQSAGEVVDVRLAMREGDSFNGSGYVVFATTEEAQKALLELNNKKFLESSVKLFPEKRKNFDGSKTLIFKNISYEAQKADVLEFFKSAGEVVDVRLAMNEDDSFKGRGHVVFATTEEAQKALLELNGQKLLERSVLLFPGKEEKKVECGKTLLIKNLSFQVQKADVLEFFKPAGEVVDVRLAMRKGDSFKGYAHVDFATAEQAEKALLELKGKKLLRSTVKLARKEEKEGEESTGGKTLVVKNVSSKVQKADVLEFFKPAGEVVDVRLATREGDSSKGYGHVDFATAEQAEKALQELNGKKLLQRAVKLIVEEPRL